MQTQHYKRLFILSLLTAVSFSLGLAGLALAQAPNTLTRDLEPVVVSGGQVLGLINTPLDEMFIYVDNGGSIVQIPFQIDEKDSSGYVASENSLFDGNDEIVFMAGDLGDQIDPTTPISATLPISPTWYEIQVTDPTTGNKGWAYVVRSNSLSYGVSTDYVDYTPANRRISSANYSLGLASAFPGLDYLTLNGGPDILDRTKLRAIISNGLFSVEEDDIPGPAVTLIKDGPVRVILDQSASNGFGGTQASVETTYKAYESLIESTADTSFTLTLGSLTSVRTTVDLNSAASGATFYNKANTSGVTINGSPDAVPSTPLSTWSQVSHTSGRFIQVSDLTSVGGTQANYYCDNLNAECDGSETTGDGNSYGEAGFVFSGAINTSFTPESWLFMLPSGGNVGQTYQNYFDNRLSITSKASPSAEAGIKRVFLPIVIK